MSMQDDRRAERIIPAERVTGFVSAERSGFISAGASRPRRSRWQLWAIGILAAVFLLQVVYQLFFTNRSFADMERLKALGKLSMAPAKAKGDSNDWPPSSPPKLWEKPTWGGYSSLAVAAGRVYTLIQDGQDEAAVCWDAKDGT